jgi:hypothetical protein
VEIANNTRDGWARTGQRTVDRLISFVDEHPMAPRRDEGEAGGNRESRYRGPAAVAQRQEHVHGDSEGLASSRTAIGTWSAGTSESAARGSAAEGTMTLSVVLSASSNTSTDSVGATSSMSLM